MTSERPRHDPHGSRDALLMSAMELFAREGIGAVSVRAVNRTAGLAPGAVHYHYGSKQALVDAAVGVHAGEVLDGIGRACDKLLARTELPTPRDLVDTFAGPYLRLLREDPSGGACWLSIVAQLILADDERLAALSAPVTGKLEALAQRTFRAASTERIRVALPAALVTFIQMLVRGGLHSVDHNGSRTQALTDFVTGGLIAVLSQAGESGPAPHDHAAYPAPPPATGTGG